MTRSGCVSVLLNTSLDVEVRPHRARARPKLGRRQQVATGGLLVGLGVYAAATGNRTTS